MSRVISEIIIHCSDSDIDAHDDIEVIRKWHTDPEPDGNGWSDVGYHYFIKSDGTIQEGRDEDTIGAHTHGHNSHSIGICLHGKDEFTEPQFRHLANLIKHIQGKYDIKRVAGHYAYSDYKSCPNFDVEEFKRNYNITTS